MNKVHKPANRLIIIFIIYFLYAVLRYNVVKEVPFTEIPLYILNKAISWLGITSLCLSYLISSLAKFKIIKNESIIASKRKYGILGFALISTHVLISIINLNPQLYDKFYNNSGVLNFSGQLSILFGVISFIIFCIPFINSLINKDMTGSVTWKKYQQYGYYALITVLLHLFFMGYTGWFNVMHWPAYMPPITLLAAILVLSALILKIIRHFQKIR